MKRMYMLLTAAALTVAVGCKETKDKIVVEEEVEVVEETTTPDDKPAPRGLKIALEPKSDSNVTGTVSIFEEDGKVTLQAEVSDATPGMHAIHLHEKADCTSADGKSSGGHWNPTFTDHGKWGAEEGYHKGDVGNFEVGENGYGMITFTTDQWCIGCGDEKKDVLGKAIIVHQGTDDFTSQPSGAAGARVSCGGIIQ